MADWSPGDRVTLLMALQRIALAVERQAEIAAEQLKVSQAQVGITLKMQADAEELNERIIAAPMPKP